MGKAFAVLPAGTLPQEFPVSGFSPAPFSPARSMPMTSRRPMPSSGVRTMGPLSLRTAGGIRPMDSSAMNRTATSLPRNWPSSRSTPSPTSRTSRRPWTILSSMPAVTTKAISCRIPPCRAVWYSLPVAMRISTMISSVNMSPSSPLGLPMSVIKRRVIPITVTGWT